MAKVSNSLIAGTILLVCLNGTAAAGQLTYRPINPSFGGDPFNSAHLLGIANANDRYKDPDAVDIEEVLNNIDFGTAGATTAGTTGTAGSGVLTDGIGNGTSSGTANTTTDTTTGTSSGTATRSGLGLSITPNSDGSFTIR